jgi:transposase
MLGFHSAQRFFICTVPIDMRKGIDGLCGSVRHLLEEDPLSGYVFIFFNKPRDKIKLLVWDKDGYVLYQKRLERGRFEELPNSPATKMKIPYDYLVMLLSGISIRHLVQRKRYSAFSTISAG